MYRPDLFFCFPERKGNRENVNKSSKIERVLQWLTKSKRVLNLHMHMAEKKVASQNRVEMGRNIIGDRDHRQYGNAAV